MLIKLNKTKTCVNALGTANLAATIKAFSQFLQNSLVKKNCRKVVTRLICFYLIYKLFCTNLVGFKQRQYAILFWFKFIFHWEDLDELKWRYWWNWSNFKLAPSLETFKSKYRNISFMLFLLWSKICMKQESKICFRSNGVHLQGQLKARITKVKQF